MEYRSKLTSILTLDKYGYNFEFDNEHLLFGLIQLLLVQEFCVMGYHQY